MRSSKIYTILFCLFLFYTGSISAQPGIVKTWDGTLNISGTLIKVVIHITQSADGKYNATVDSPDQGAMGIPVSSVTFDSMKIKIEIASIGGVYEGIVNDSYTRIKGEWVQQGNTLPLVLTPSGENKPEEKLNFFSLWEGKLSVGSTKLTLIAKFYKDSDGAIGGFIDSPDQGVKDLAASKIHYGDDSVYFYVDPVKGYYSGKFNKDKTQIDGNWYQAGQTFKLVLNKTDKVEEVKHSQEPKKPYPYNDEEVTFVNNEAGDSLAGTFTYPKEGTNFPVAILVTGSGPQNRDEELLGHKPFLVWSDYLTRNGIAVLRYDDRGIGKSTGNFGSGTSQDFASDAVAAVNYLKTRKEINSKKIGVIGHSEGGLIAPIVANKSGDVSFIVLAAGPAVPGSEIIMLQTELISRKNGESEKNIKEMLDVMGKAYNAISNSKDSAEADKKIEEIWEEYHKALPDSEKTKPENTREFMDQQKKSLLSPWFRYFLKFDPRTELVKLHIPVLAMYGENDLQVPPSQNKPEMEKALQKSGTKNYKIVLLPKLNHLFQESETGSPSEYAKIDQTASPQMLEVMTGWIKEVTK